MIFFEQFYFIYLIILEYINHSILIEIFPSLALSYNATVLLILLSLLLLLLSVLLVRQLHSHVPLQVRIPQAARRFRRRDKIRYHAIRFGRRFSEITEELKKVNTKEERRATIVNFVQKIFKLRDSERSPALAYSRLPESFFEPDEEEDSSLPEDLRLMISSVRVFGHLDKSFFLDFCKFIKTVQLEASEYLFRDGDPDENVYVVRSGMVRINIIEPDGTRSVITEVGKGGSIDSLLSVQGVLTGYPFVYKSMEAIALEPSTLLCLPARSFLEICKPQTPSMFRMIQMITVRLQRLSFNAMHNYLGLSSELFKQDLQPGPSKSHDYFCELFNRKMDADYLAEFPNVELTTNRDQMSDNKVQNLWLFNDYNNNLVNCSDDVDEIERKSSNYSRWTGSGALELGEVPCLRNRTRFTTNQQVLLHSPQKSDVISAIRRSHSFDSSLQSEEHPPCVFNQPTDFRGKLNSCETVKLQRPDLSTEFCLSQEEIAYLLKFAEDDLARLLNLKNSSIIHGHLLLVSVSSGTILSKQSEMQTEMYLVVYGQLDAVQHTVGTDTDQVSTIFSCGPGHVAGLLGLITGEPNIYTIRASSKSILAVFSRDCFYSVVRQYPEALFSVSYLVASHMSPLLHQLDFALEWISVKAGKALYKKGDSANHVYVVLSGRLRQVDHLSDGGRRIVEELGRSDLVGFLEVISCQPRISTVIAIRDSEVAQIPSQLLHYLKNKVPQVLTRIIQLLSDKLLGNLTTSSDIYSPLSMPLLHMTSTNSLGSNRLELNNPNFDCLYSQLNSGAMKNLRTIAVLPASDDINAEAFTLELQHSMTLIGSSVRLTSRTVLKRLGSNAFDSVSQYRLSSWLGHQEDLHRIVFFVCDYKRASAWNRLCIRQADCLLVLALGNSNPSQPSAIEMALKNDPTKVAKVLILMYPLDTDYPRCGQTAKWLNNRPWIGQHYHIRCETRVLTARSPENLISFYSQVFAREEPNPLSDFSRLARYLTGEAIGLVLGGGGARGCSHVGVIRAFHEAGIPIDLVGGTSIGAFMSALWADETRVAQFTQRARNFTNCFNSIWNKLKDFTYPAVSLFSGKELNRQLESVFHDRQLEDLWLPCFCITTDVSNCKMRIHTQGSVWRYVRASMSLSGYLPPLCDPYDGSLLLDGGYTNNLPADVMACFGAKTIFANDVGAAVEKDLSNYGDHLSGWYLLYNRFFKVNSPLRIPSLTEIQARLAYISCVRQLEYVKASGICHYLRPPIDKYLTLQFSAFDEINNVGYDYTNRLISQWHEQGNLKNLIHWLRPHITVSANNTFLEKVSVTPSHVSAKESNEKYSRDSEKKWIKQNFGDQLIFIDLADSVAKTNYTSMTDSQDPTEISNKSINQYQTSNVKLKERRIFTKYDSSSIPTSSSRSSADFVDRVTQNHKSETMPSVKEFNHGGVSRHTTLKSSQKYNLTLLEHKFRNRSLIDSFNLNSDYGVSTQYSDNESATKFHLKVNPLSSQLIRKFQSVSNLNHLTKYKIDKREFKNLQNHFSNPNINSITSYLNVVKNKPYFKSAEKYIDQVHSNLPAELPLEDDGYLEDGESDRSNSPTVASDPELTPDVFPDPDNNNVFRPRSLTISHFHSYSSKKNELSVSLQAYSNPLLCLSVENNSKLEKFGNKNNSTELLQPDSTKRQTTSNKHVRKRHRSSLNRLRPSRDYSNVAKTINRPN